MKIEKIILKKREQSDSGYGVYHEKIGALSEEVKARIYKHREVLTLEESEKRQRIYTLGQRYLEQLCENAYKDLLLQNKAKRQLLEDIMKSLFGYGRLDAYIHDERVTEIMVNGTDDIFVERGGRLETAYRPDGTKETFQTEDEIYHLIDKIVAPINRKVDQSHPIVDARLSDGSRVNIVVPPVALEGPTITIRKFPKHPLTLEKLMALGALNEALGAFLVALVQTRHNIIVSGGTGSGKTTFLNALSAYIPPSSRVITIEDSAELQIQQIENLVRMEARPATIEGKGEITIRDLVRSALRMRPDSIVVGEVRGGEALDMLQAMNTGHDGSITTAHANSACDMLYRLETMVLMAGVELPLAAIRQQIVSAVDVVVHLTKLESGQRIVAEVVEVEGLTEGGYKLNPLFTYSKQAPQTSEMSLTLKNPYKIQRRTS